MMDSNEARAALDKVGETDRRMAEQMTWPIWRHAAFGFIEALLLLGLALPLAGMAACLVIAMAGLSWIIHDDRARYGMFVSGYSSRAARPAIVLAFAIFAGGIAAIFFTGGLNTWNSWTPVIVTVVFVGETLASIWWQALHQADLRRSGTDA